jgi:DNA-binding GntR family transcriptional regulator
MKSRNKDNNPVLTSDFAAAIQSGEDNESLFGDEGGALPSLKVSLADRVADYLRQAIFRGKIAPGEQLREVPLSQILGISRGPIRDALQQLEREGLVTIPRNGRTIVARLTREDFDEVYSLRVGLERVAMLYAIRNATPADLEEMQRVVNTMVERVNQGIDEKDAADLDLQFHDVVYQASRHKRLQAVWADLRPQIYIFLLSRNVADSDFRVQMARHQELVDVIRERDEPRALECIETHLRVAYTRIIKTYESG